MIGVERRTSHYRRRSPRSLLPLPLPPPSCVIYLNNACGFSRTPISSLIRPKRAPPVRLIVNAVLPCLRYVVWCNFNDDLFIRLHYSPCELLNYCRRGTGLWLFHVSILTQIYWVWLKRRKLFVYLINFFYNQQIKSSFKMSDSLPPKH